MWKPWVKIGFPLFLVAMAVVGGLVGMLLGVAHDWIDRRRGRR